MKKLVYILFFLFSFANVFSQKDSLEIYSVVEEMPEFPGGMPQLMKYLQESINYPMKAKENGISGKVFVKYVVGINGKIEDVKVLRSSGSGLLDSEAVRVVSVMPDWIPGKQNGKVVPVYYNLPINFKLDSYNNTSSSIKFTSSYFSNYSPNMPTGLVFCDLYGNVIRDGDKKFQSLPEYPGGLDSLVESIRRNKRFDAGQIKNKTYDQAYAKFTIDPTGQVLNPEILISSGSDSIDKEAIRVITCFGKWKPAIKENQSVKTYCKLSINLYGGSISSKTNSNFDKQKKANAFYDKGVKEYQLGNLGNAIINFDKCLELNNKDVDALYNKGAIHYKLNEVDKACVAWYRIKELGRTDADNLITKYCNDTTSKKTDLVKEVMPEYSGGYVALNNFINTNIKYPVGVKNYHIKCDEVFIEVVIEVDGSIGNIVVQKSSGNKLVDDEAKRLVSLMPKWIPGKVNGEVTRMPRKLSVRFPNYDVKCVS